MCSKCNQAKQSYARMTDIMERGKIGVLLIAHKNSDNKSLQSPDISFLGKEKEALNLGNIPNQKQHFL